MPVVETERHGQVLVVRMTRPERLNALNHEMRTALAETWSAFRHDDALEVAIFVPMIAVVLWMGLYPSSFIDVIATSVDKLVTNYQAAVGPTKAAMLSGQ